MRMSGWTLFLLSAGLLAAFGLFMADERRRQHELLRMERMRGSALYYQLYPLVRYARRYSLDRVRVERDRVIFYGVCPPGRIGEFSLSQHGFRPMTAERTRALAQVLAEDLPALQAASHYRLRRYWVARPNGMRDYGYVYEIRSGYKTALMYARQAQLYEK